MADTPDLFDPANEPKRPPFGTDPHKLVRRNDPDTSKEAAYSVDTTKLEAKVLEVIRGFKAKGCISDSVRGAYPDLPYSSVTARFKALLDKGFIVDSGRRLPGTSGRSQRVLVAKEFFSE